MEKYRYKIHHYETRFKHLELIPYIMTINITKCTIHFDKQFIFAIFWTCETLLIWQLVSIKLEFCEYIINNCYILIIRHLQMIIMMNYLTKLHLKLGLW